MTADSQSYRPWLQHVTPFAVKVSATRLPPAEALRIEIHKRVPRMGIRIFELASENLLAG